MEYISTSIFFLFLIPSFGIWMYIFNDKTELISKRYYSMSTLIFLGIATFLFVVFLISQLLMAIFSGILIGMWGALVFKSYKIKKEENERKWGKN